MSDRPQRPSANRRPGPGGATPPRTPPASTEATPAGEPAGTSVPRPQEPTASKGEPSATAATGDRTEAAAGERAALSPSVSEPAASTPSTESTAEPPAELRGAAAQDYPELSASAREPEAAARPVTSRAATSVRETIPPVAARREQSYRGLALGLAATLLLVLGLIATAPFWAPLLPWGDQRPDTDPAMVERLDAEQQQIRRLEQQIAAATAATPHLEQRIAALEQKPPPSSPDLGELRQQVAASSSGMSELTTRLERLENSVQAQAGGLSELRTGLDQLSKAQQAQAGDLSELKTGLDRLGQAQQARAGDLSELKTGLDRLGQTTQAQAGTLSELRTGLDQLGRAEQAQQQARAADLAARLNPLTQGLQAQQSSLAALDNRLQAFEKTAQSRAGGLTDMGLMLALVQIRNAVEAGTPFPAQYEALTSLAKGRPDIAAAAAPLAEAARTGTADRAELAQELQGLAQQVDAGPAAGDGEGGWAGAALDRLRGLVRVRRADETDPGKQAAAAISVAERSLAGGDLARAVAAVETLQEPGQGQGQGPAASAIAEWLRKARERLAVEAALHRLEALLTARLGDTAPALPQAPGTPG